ncbi:hypothetical protein HPSA_07460 [Helicobacter pylori SouthAfrica7]|uniref:Uncharacterized protein n=1 Tax=Helicobacter pylori (strain SouthAfrica7) TaxID=907239 RepID=E8QUF9_HELPW|nr:hypothetical protein HPSA_07460 [Helicobacter pylori SouthAfrica7]
MRLNLKSNKVLVLYLMKIEPLDFKALLFLCYNQSKKTNFFKTKDYYARDFFMLHF